MDIDDKLGILKKIQQVDAPPFLFTRIKARIQSHDSADAPAPLGWNAAYIAIGMAILLLNISVFFMSSNKQNNMGIEEVISSMEISTTNELYHE